MEQKYAAAGMQSATGEDKLAEVMTLAGSAVSALLAQAGITSTADYVQTLVAAVVAVLNVQPAPAAVATAK